jgi:hypothetical protein
MCVYWEVGINLFYIIDLNVRLQIVKSRTAKDLAVLSKGPRPILIKKYWREETKRKSTTNKETEKNSGINAV